MTVFCELNVGKKRHLPEISAEIKPLIITQLADVFGIQNIQEIDIIINDIANDKEFDDDSTDNEKDAIKEFEESKYVSTSF